MPRTFTASPRLARLLLASSLCLLALAFAVEAKIAWFGPAVGPGSELRAAKALPSDLLRIVERCESFLLFHTGGSLAFLAPLPVLPLSLLNGFSRSEVARSAFRISSIESFSSSPLRAPPARF